MSNKENPAPGYLDMELLRFTTAGSVDDGKSTLIGRLLYDSKAIFEDQMEQLEQASLYCDSLYNCSSCWRYGSSEPDGNYSDW